MNQLVKKILGSLDNGENGASGKKMTALVVTMTCIVFPMVTYTVWAYTHNDWSLLTGLIVALIGFVTGLFITNEVGKKYKNSKANESENIDTE
jgi:membrane protein YdbS with pleckstrin-like domain